jgi:hypothetical protein
MEKLEKTKSEKMKAEANLVVMNKKFKESSLEIGRLVFEIILQKTEFLIFKDDPKGKPVKNQELEKVKSVNLALQKEIASLKEALNRPVVDPEVLKENEKLKHDLDKSKLKHQQKLSSLTSERNNLESELNSLKQTLSAPSDSDDAEKQMLKAQLAASSQELSKYRSKLSEEEGKSSQIDLLLASVHEKDKEIRLLHEKLSTIKPVLVSGPAVIDPKEKERYQDEIKTYQEENKRLSEQIKNLSVISSAGVIEQKGDDKEKKDLRKDKQLLKERNESLTQDKTLLQEKIKNLEDKIKELESLPPVLPAFEQDDTSALLAENERLKKQVEDLTAVPAELASKPGDNKEVKELKTMIKKLKKQNDFLKTSLEENKSDDLKILRESLDAANRKIQFYEEKSRTEPTAKLPKPAKGSKLSEVPEKPDPDQKRIQDLSSELASARQEVAFLKSQLASPGKADASLDQVTRLNRDLAEANAKIAELTLLVAVVPDDSSKPDNSHVQAEIAQLKRENSSLKASAAQAGQVKVLQDELARRPTAEEMQKLTDVVKNQEKQLKDLSASQGQQAKSLSDEIARLQQTLDISNKDSAAALGKLNKESAEIQQKLQKQIQDLDNARVKLEKQLGSELDNKSKMTVELEQVRKVAGEATVLGKRVEDLSVQLADLQQRNAAKEQELKDSIRQRKLLHNQLEDLKGKIRVFCRVRPLSKSELDRGCINITTIVDEFTITCESKNGVKPFVYDSVFGPNSTQDDVFEDTKRVVQSAVDGYNVCVFAYGQTGSGKTFTMTGVPGNPGVTPRAMDELFSVLNHLPSHYKWEVSCYMVELYLDTLVDLFLPANQKGNPPPLTIKKDTKGIVNIPEAIKIEVKSAREIMSRFDEGNLMRHTSSTKMNDSSSRSHLIFGVLIDVTNGETNQRTVGKLSLVDLAGSERVSKTEATAERLKEGRAINKSLTALGDVISALSSNESHIPYRNNKLTMLMSDSLGGTAKTLMFVNVSPANYNQEETTMSLFYAARVKLITNDPTKNIESKEMTVMKNELFSVSAERDKLKLFLEKKGFNPNSLGEIMESRQEDYDDPKYDDL